MSAGATKPPGGCNRKRALVKMAAVLLAIAVVVFGLSQFVDDQALDQLKHSLSLWTVITLVLIINLVSFGCFIILFFAWQWVRCDLKPEQSTDFDT